MTTCESADSVRAFKCQTEEQCDECFLKDHVKECTGCEHYDHPETPQQSLERVYAGIKERSYE